MAVQRLKDETRDLRSELKVLNPQVVSETDTHCLYGQKKQFYIDVIEKVACERRFVYLDNN